MILFSRKPKLMLELTMAAIKIISTMPIAKQTTTEVTEGTAMYFLIDPKARPSVQFFGINSGQTQIRTSIKHVVNMCWLYVQIIF